MCFAQLTKQDSLLDVSIFYLSVLNRLFYISEMTRFSKIAPFMLLCVFAPWKMYIIYFMTQAANYFEGNTQELIQVESWDYQIRSTS